MEQAFVLVKWSFIRIVIKYLNMNISFQGPRFSKANSIQNEKITFSLHAKLWENWNWNISTNSWFWVIFRLRLIRGLQLIIAIEIIHPLSDPDYFGGGVGEHILDSDSALTMTHKYRAELRALFRALSLPFSASYFLWPFLYRDAIILFGIEHLLTFKFGPWSRVLWQCQWLTTDKSMFKRYV